MPQETDVVRGGIHDGELLTGPTLANYRSGSAIRRARFPRWLLSVIMICRCRPTRLLYLGYLRSRVQPVAQAGLGMGRGPADPDAQSRPPAQAAGRRRMGRGRPHYDVPCAAPGRSRARRTAWANRGLERANRSHALTADEKWNVDMPCGSTHSTGVDQRCSSLVGSPRCWQAPRSWRA